LNKIATFSIVAYDPQESAWGIAVASKFPAVGAVVPWAKANAGAIATQSYANTTYGPRGLTYMEDGLSASKTLDRLLKDDEERDVRQVGMIDANGEAATFTGEDCYAWAGGQIGEHFAIQGNILSGPEVVDAMVHAFQEFEGDFPERLLNALLAGDRAGGDRRGRQSAALYVVKPKGGYGGFNDRWIDYRVDDHIDPVSQLSGLLKLHRLYFGKSPQDEELLIEGKIAEALQEIMKLQGYYSGPIHGNYDKGMRQALQRFIGNENFEDRTDIKAGKIDKPVFEYLVQKFTP
jgi:uncharacterized Ntn-hydrolase superfamily protein